MNYCPFSTSHLTTEEPSNIFKCKYFFMIPFLHFCSCARVCIFKRKFSSINYCFFVYLCACLAIFYLLTSVILCIGAKNVNHFYCYVKIKTLNHVLENKYKNKKLECVAILLYFLFIKLIGSSSRAIINERCNCILTSHSF